MSPPLIFLCSLLWTPVPPKLTLHPHTVTQHLLPSYSSPHPLHAQDTEYVIQYMYMHMHMCTYPYIKHGTSYMYSVHVHVQDEKSLGIF